MENSNLSPICYAIAGFFMVPIIALILIISAILLIIGLPGIPFVLYAQQKKINSNKEWNEKN